SPEDRERLRAAVRSWTDELVRLDALAADEGRARDLARTVAAGTERLDAIAREAEAVETELAGLPERLARARADVDDARNAAATLDAASAAREAAADRVSASEQWRARSAERAGVAEDVHRAEARHLDARAHRLDLTERRITGMAAELAAALVPGEPCGVCGAREHPEPAQPTGDPVTDAQERAAVDAEKARAEEADAVRMRLAELDRALDVLAARGGDGDPSELADLLATADAALADLRTRAGRLDELLARVAELDVADTRLTARLAELTAERATLTERIGSAETERERIAETLTRAAGDDGTVAARRTRVDALAVAGANLLEVRDDAVRAGERAVDATARAARLAAEAGFADLEAAGAAVRSADRRDEIVAILDGARADEAAARAVLAEDAVREAAEIEVDVAAAEAVAAAASRDAELAVAAASDADRRVADLERYAAKLAAALTRLEPIRAEHDELAALADVVAGRGSNSRRMSLRSYVLAARLEEVAVAASSRLRRMSNGRYEFVHSDDAGPRGKRGGLGLDIRDDFTGVVRSAKTLSGGESFVASLSLALGLADVVAAESGGVVLDTLFIDEGFGTLDADTLDQVMAVLDELRDGGRVVGIVSHVDEMRQRIPNRLHVVHGRAGSTLEMIAG
ncbi:SbcC/MukB-like Walker B domain-containing protein, partial [Rhodococcus rhodnii]